MAGKSPKTAHPKHIPSIGPFCLEYEGVIFRDPLDQC